MRPQSYEGQKLGTAKRMTNKRKLEKDAAWLSGKRHGTQTNAGSTQILIPLLSVSRIRCWDVLGIRVYGMRSRIPARLAELAEIEEGGECIRTPGKYLQYFNYFFVQSFCNSGAQE